MRAFPIMRAFPMITVLGMLGVTFITEAHAKINPVDREAGKVPFTSESLETYTLVKLKRVYFRSDASSISVAEKAALNEVLKCFSGTAKPVIELRAYRDGAEGRRLAGQRSQAIVQYLSTNGVPADRILSVATDEIADWGNSENPEHRRVDVRIFTASSLGDSNETPGLQEASRAVQSATSNGTHRSGASGSSGAK